MLTCLSIIAVHGLDYVDATGTCAGSSWREPAGQVWLSVFLRENNIKARLFLYEYDSQDTFKGVSGNMSTRADDLIRQISTARTNFVGGCFALWHKSNDTATDNHTSRTQSF